MWEARSSQMRFGQLASVLRPCPKSQLHEHIARLCVLYEDLRVEMAGITQEEIGPLEAISEDKYRRNYFLRRSVATLREFAETYRLLSKCSDLQLLTKSFNQVAARRWERALSFFLKHESFFKLVRNDIGGHFGLNAAVYSLSTLGPTITGKIEYARYRDKGQGVKLHFASEIAARAYLKH